MLRDPLSKLKAAWTLRVSPGWKILILSQCYYFDRPVSTMMPDGFACQCGRVSVSRSITPEAILARLAPAVGHHVAPSIFQQRHQKSKPVLKLDQCILRSCAVDEFDQNHARKPSDLQ
jgi:hypothetical protein